LVIPPNIAPLNFVVQEPGAAYRIRLRGANSGAIELKSRSSSIQFPLAPWRDLLNENKGQRVLLDIAVENAAGQLRHFQTITNVVAQEAIDGYLAYRLLGPLYNAYKDLGIYQRNLESFEESTILQNSSFNQGCVNCHTFLNRRPDTLALHIREKSSGNPMMLVVSNRVARVAQTGGYLAWHPSGRLLTFSANKLTMFFHTIGETRDVYDANSDLRIYRVDSNTVVTPPAISVTNLNETWPAWSPDGLFLYYCRAPQLPSERFRQLRYDLVRVSYDITRDIWGEPEVLVSGRESGLSAALPRVSPDGRSVVFCLSKYGNFPIYQPSSDLYLLDTQSRRYQKLEINSDVSDTWHSWSSNGRWMVFSSKRRDSLFTRPHFTYVDATNGFHKPFILPQEDPAFYDTYLKNYNLPELVTGRVEVAKELAESVLRPTRELKPEISGKPGNPASPAQRKPEYDEPPEIE
jgi:hypothetical protein